MRSFLKKLFIENWPRKLISLIIAIIIWILVNRSITTTKTLHNVPIKITNIPAGKTIEGIQDNGYLSKKRSLTLTGNKNVLDDLTGSDIEVVLDAKGKNKDWIVNITPKNLVCINPDIDLQKSITKVAYLSFVLKITNLTTEKIPIHLTQPVGEAPKGFVYLDVWPYQLFVTVKGPFEDVKKLKNKGLKLTFNLNDISSEDLQKARPIANQKDEISFSIPENWKKINLPMISEKAIIIDDPSAKALRINFSKRDLLPINKSIPITLFFPMNHSKKINPDSYSLAINDFITKKRGITIVNTPLYASGVSKLFLDIVKDMLQIVVIASNKKHGGKVLWNAQFIYPHELEDRYVAKLMSEGTDQDFDNFQPHLREEYLRNRFRNYINKFRLFTSNNEKLSLDINFNRNTISVIPTEK